MIELDDASIRVEPLLLAWEKYTYEVFNEVAEIKFPDDPQTRVEFMNNVRAIVGERK